jgi:hypothetical protein
MMQKELREATDSVLLWYKFRLDLQLKFKSPPFLKGDLGGFVRGYGKSPLAPL